MRPFKFQSQSRHDPRQQEILFRWQKEKILAGSKNVFFCRFQGWQKKNFENQKEDCTITPSSKLQAFLKRDRPEECNSKNLTGSDPLDHARQGNKTNFSQKSFTKKQPQMLTEQQQTRSSFAFFFLVEQKKGRWTLPRTHQRAWQSTRFHVSPRSFLS